jgi:uncharacterized protein (DUF2225 family)
MYMPIAWKCRALRSNESKPVYIKQALIFYVSSDYYKNSLVIVDKR